MKIAALLFGIIFAFLLGDFLWSQHPLEMREGSSVFVEKRRDLIPFDHKLHGDSIGLDCATCHRGARSGKRALFPSKKDCLDCHRLPLTESAGIEKLDSTLKITSEHPWSKESSLPEHVVFHHGVHAAAGVTCASCHGNSYLENKYGGEKIDMKTCIQCHRGQLPLNQNLKKAATDCATCHR